MLHRRSVCALALLFTLLGPALAGQPLSHPTTQAYGCSIKYP